MGKRRAPGFVLGPASAAPKGLRDVETVLDDAPALDEELLAFLRRAADYYLHPLGEVLQAALPPRMQAKSRVGLSLTEIGRKRAPLLEGTAEGRVLSALGGGPRSERALLARTPGLSRAALEKLVRDGIVARQEHVSSGQRAVRETEIVVRLPGDPPPRLGVRQRQALERLDAAGEIPLAELVRVVPGARAAVRAFVAKGIARLERRVVPDPFDAAAPHEPPRTPNPAQARAIEALSAALDAGRYAGFLLHGVTGSGKTEVYLHVIARALASGRGALVLVPEIALTPQLAGRFRARLGDAVAVLHSGLSEAERLDAWRSLKSGVRRVAVGARSALFAGIPKLGVLVVDEEHDPSFKQEEGFRYHARDLALLRGRQADALVVLGSATPSMESWHNAQNGKLGLLELPERATARALPPVEVVSLARHAGGPTGHAFFTAPLVRALEETLAAGGQAILFLNRRGFAPALACESCGEAVRCPRCSVALVHHRGTRMLRCHYCDHAAEMPTACPACGGRLVLLGIGTEQVEAAVREAFPGAKVGRLDRDVATGQSAERVLDRLRRRDIDVLVGTQMVAKGHDFPGVTLVGVLAADASLHMPDFRAAERTFQLLCQVAGRAGRGEEPGRVVVQALAPNHHAIRLAATHDAVAFCLIEAPRREELGYPPFGRLAAVVVDGPDETRTERAAEGIGRSARDAAGPEVVVLGPAPAPLARLRGRWRFRLLLRSRKLAALRACLAALEPALADLPPRVRAAIDVDPISML
jgi:primosomal protein N' (replication factor Y)